MEADGTGVRLLSSLKLRAARPHLPALSCTAGAALRSVSVVTVQTPSSQPPLDRGDSLQQDAWATEVISLTEELS